MCLNPISIKNLNKGIKCNKGDPRYYKDRQNTYIGVPCGWCSECIALKQMGYIQRIMEESRKNHIFMIMYSYNEKMIPRYEKNGYIFKYADIQDFVHMVKRLRKWRKEKDQKHSYLPWDFRYFGVTELGGKRGRPHFHIFILIKKEVLKTKAEIYNAEKIIWKVMLENWVRNTGSNKKPVYEPLLNYAECWRGGVLHRNYDCQYVEPAITSKGGGIEDAAWYIMKYALKDSGKERRRQQALKLNLPQKEYLEAWEKIKTKAFYSTYFGLGATKEITPFGDVDLIIDEDIKKHIRKGIDYGKNKKPFPIWINDNNGQTFPLCEYYKKYFMTIKDIDDYFIDDEQRRLEIKIERDIDKHRHYKRKTKRDQEIWNEHNLSELDYILEKLNS